jgi:5-methylthioadenosine/S-adenosylhomocysteine deaminase
MTWLQDHIWPVEARWVESRFRPRRRPDWRLRKCCAAASPASTTCTFSRMWSPAAARDCRNARLRGPDRPGFPDRLRPPSWTNILAKGTGVARRALKRAEALLHTAFAPHAPYTVSATGAWSGSAGWPTNSNFPIHIHVHETAAEMAQFHRRARVSAAGTAGATGPMVTLAPCWPCT